MSDVESMMAVALAEAEDAARRHEVPVGAAIFNEGRLISRAGNLRESNDDPLGHAELLVIRDAAKQLGSWRLDGCTLVVTLEPCIMCAGAILNSRVASLIFGAYDSQAGACGSVYNVLDDPRLNHRVSIRGGVSRFECSSLLEQFFIDRR